MFSSPRKIKYVRGDVKSKPSFIINHSLFCVVLAAHAQSECDIGRKTPRTIKKDSRMNKYEISSMLLMLSAAHPLEVQEKFGNNPDK